MSEAAPERQEQAVGNSTVVASVLSGDRVVINKGANDGIKIGQRCLVYELTDLEITDPLTNESLGRLEEPKGTGKIVSVQDRMAVLESEAEPSSTPPNPVAGISTIALLLTPVAKGPFRDVHVGDLVKSLH